MAFVDQYTRVERLARQIEVRYRKRFLEIIEVVRESKTLTELETLLAAGRVEEALIVSEQAAIKLGNLWGESFVYSGTETAEFLGGALHTVVSFDTLNERALNVMRLNQLRNIKEFTEKQMIATREALKEGIARGINPRDMAREFRGSIGLTQRQVAAVGEYRKLLEARSKAALRRALHDRRFSRMYERAIEQGRPLTPEQIDRMVNAYRRRYLKYRSETIARTESLSAAHAGSDEMYMQAIENGTLAKEDLLQEWIPSRDEIVRDSHSTMKDQKRPVGEPFVSGLGNLLMHPGDPAAPAEDAVNCRCGKTTRFKEKFA